MVCARGALSVEVGFRSSPPFSLVSFSSRLVCLFLFHDDDEQQYLKMPPSGQDELEYLKSLAKRLQDRINDLERKVLSTTPAPTTPELRMILMGPPGAGQYLHHSSSMVGWGADELVG